MSAASLEFLAIARVASVILCGVILHAKTDRPSPGFGIRWRDPSGRSGWCNASSARPWCSRSEDVARARAARLTGSSSVAATYFAEALPVETVMSSCGPFAVAGEEPGTNFRCLDGSGEVVPVVHLVPFLTRSGGLDHEEEDDSSAFAAARAFVQRHGVEGALAAIANAEAKHRGKGSEDAHRDAAV